MEMLVWPKMIYQVYSMEIEFGDRSCMLFALPLLCIVGFRYPLKMLPLLFWRLTWKDSWLINVALSDWLRGQRSRDLGATTFAVGMIVISAPLVPWTYVFDHHPKEPGDR